MGQDRKELELALLESEEQYRGLFSQMQQPVSVHEIVQNEHGKVVDYVFVDGNQSLERLLKISMDELRGKSIRFVNPHVSDETVEALGRVALTGEPLTQDYHSIRAGRDFQVVSYSPRRGRFVSIHTDVTDWKRAEASLREANNILHALNTFSLEQADCRTSDDLVEMITRQLASFAEPVVVTFNAYDPVRKVLALKKLRADPQALERVVGLVGDEFLRLEVPISEEMCAKILDPNMRIKESLFEATAGTIPVSLSAAVQKAARIDCFVVVPFAIEGVLFGTVFLGVRDKQLVPPASFLEPFAYMSSISMRRVQAEERLRHMSFHDQLTGLNNRHYLEHRMKCIDAGYNLPLSVIMADLNGLKAVNDTYGHLHGDEVLLAIAKVLRENCRPEDIVIRWGGDEFLVLLANTSADIAEGISKSIADKCNTIRGGDIPVTVALGVASKTAVDQTLATVMREAEDAMYKNKLSESSSARSGVLSALLTVLEEKSYETQAHTTRMQEVALRIGSTCQLPPSELHRLMLVIMLHDIGKINIPEELLTRRGPLNDDEWRTMRQHPEVGARIARATPDFAHVANDILSHHERWDGSGYPHGLKGESIPLLARITAIADAFEVMSNGRPYKSAMTPDQITGELIRGAGTQFDPTLVEIFLRLRREK